MTCHICSKETSLQDFYINDKGRKITGNTYPSIDHVLPMSKGGLNEWSNVKVAHRLCNSIKRDKLDWK